MKKFVVNEEETLKKFTDNVYPQGSFYWNALLKKRDIRVNGVKTGKDMPVHMGDTIVYYTTPAQEAKPAFQRVYEDENVLVVDKESGVNSEAVFSSLLQSGEYYFIHRLDRNTEGLMIFAKNASAERCLLCAFREKRMTKIYRAVCLGEFPSPKGVLTAYWTKNENSSFVTVSETDNGGEKLVTEYAVLQREGELNFVEIRLHTGKTHQIRAHLAHVGCPVLGDTKYGDKAANERYHLTRQCLIAKELIPQTDGVLSYLSGKRFLSEREWKIKR